MEHFFTNEKTVQFGLNVIGFGVINIRFYGLFFIEVCKGFDFYVRGSLGKSVDLRMHTPERKYL